jgi:hypothetical protein
MAATASRQLPAVDRRTSYRVAYEPSTCLFGQSHVTTMLAARDYHRTDLMITRSAYYCAVSLALAAICIPSWENTTGATSSLFARSGVLIICGAVLAISLLRIIAGSLVLLRLLLVGALAACLGWTMVTATRSIGPTYESLLRKQPDLMILALSRRATMELVSCAVEVLLLLVILLALFRYSPSKDAT